MIPPRKAIEYERYEFKKWEHFNAETIVERIYPHGSVASHLLGYVTRDDSSVEGEEAYFSYRLPDYRGVVGIEGGLDANCAGGRGRSR